MRPWPGAASFALAAVLACAPGRATAARADDLWRTPVVPHWRVGREIGPLPFALGSASALLMDPVTGRVLYEHAAFVRRPPASTTKILTAYLVLQRGDLDRVVTVSRRAATTEGSRMHLRAGERIRVRALLTGLLLRSGNDAAEALAEATDGSAERFALRMNRVARALGARGSHFENPHGLPDPRHYTTAYDLARIARAALALPAFRALVTLEHARVEDEEGRVFDMTNTNRLLQVMAGADGVKTGTTSAAGRCLVASATRGGFPLLAVVLRSPDRWGESAALLEWGYRNFVPVASPLAGRVARLPLAGRPFAHADVILAAPLRAVVPRPLVPRVRTRLWLPARLSAAARPGAVVGTAVLEAGGRVLAQAPLAVGTTSDRH
ncbi:MAG: D-alanyl-D-alanine carboxypeptidase [Firmicutes bacterium]|nr:D-alanyl-D-alanine carboxypeptidase [Bacillota bacterium]